MDLKAPSAVCFGGSRGFSCFTGKVAWLWLRHQGCNQTCW